MIPRHGMETGKFFVSQLSEIFQNSKITVWMPKFTRGQDYLLPMNFEIRISYFVGQWFNHKAMDLITGLKLVCDQKKTYCICICLPKNYISLLFTTNQFSLKQISDY